MKKVLYILLFMPLCCSAKTDKDSITATKIVNIEQRLSNIENTTKEFSMFLQNNNITAEIVTAYFKGLSLSKFKDYKQVYEVFFENINNREKQFELFDKVDSIKETRIAKIMYGNILKSNFSKDAIRKRN